MIRVEGPGWIVRYDGNEAVVHVERFRKSEPMSLDELVTLRNALNDAIAVQRARVKRDRKESKT